MGGIVGRLFREFAVTLSIAIGVSMVVSLTATPMMCAHLLKERGAHGWIYRISERFFNGMINAYGNALRFVLRHCFITLLVLLCTIGLNVYLFIRVPKGFFPQQDNGRMMGQIIADQDTSFQAMDRILRQMIRIVVDDPAVSNVMGFTGGGTLNTARMFVMLKPIDERKINADLVMARLRPKLARVPGASLYLQAAQDVRVGGRSSAAQYQFTMRGDNVQDLITYAPSMYEQLKIIPIITDINSDQQNKGLQAEVNYDRKTAARFGVSPQLIDDTLYDAFGQREVSVMYTSLNQYHVVMVAQPQYLAKPSVPEPDLCAGAQWAADSPQRFRKVHAYSGPALGQPPGIVPRGDDLIQSPAGNRAGRCGRRHHQSSTESRPAPYDSDHVCGNGTGISRFAGK